MTNYYPTFYYNDPRYVTCNGTYCNSISLMLNVNQMYPSSFSLYIKVIGMGRTTDLGVIGKKEDFTWYLAAGREQDTVGNEKNSEGSKNTEHFWKVWRYDETDTKHTSTPIPHRSYYIQWRFSHVHINPSLDDWLNYCIISWIYWNQFSITSAFGTCFR